MSNRLRRVVLAVLAAAAVALGIAATQATAATAVAGPLCGTNWDNTPCP